MKNKIIIVGVGPGEKCFLTFRAEEIIKNSRCVVAAERHAVLASGQCNVILLKNFFYDFYYFAFLKFISINIIFISSLISIVI